MRYIYIAFIRAHTALAAAGRLFTGFEYTHCAVCTDSAFNEFLTFSRRRHYLPFDAGFMRETRGCYAFGGHRKSKARIYRIPVTGENYERVMDFINNCESGDYVFNLLSMVTSPLLHGVGIDGAHNCVSFCARAAELAGVTLARPCCKYDLVTLDRALSHYPFREGQLIKHREDAPAGYMDMPSVGEYFSAARSLLSALAECMKRGVKWR